MLSDKIVKKLVALVFLGVHFEFVLSQQQEDDNDEGNNNNVTLLVNDSDLLSNSNENNDFLFTNYNALREEGQGFFLLEGSTLYETPDSLLITGVQLYWWCDLEFVSDDDNHYYGYVGRSVAYFLGSTVEQINAQGAQTPSTPPKRTYSVSAIMVPTLGIFEGQMHGAHDDDDFVYRFWDDGNPTHPFMGWEGYVEGDTTYPNSDTSSAFSAVGKLTKITTEEAATYLNRVEKYISIIESDLTPSTCRKQYKAAWDDETHNKPADPINTTTMTMTMTTLEEEVAQLKFDNNELMSRVASIEESVAAGGGGGGGGGSDPTSIPTSAWYDNNGIIENMIKPIMLLTAGVAGLILVDFL
ncbi:hypothetical protein FRACYDRAFT_268856 [Fragilariopsis cylindrus CCMP1102]|uniref:Uncharacterized protein n=1 Tax=Fragilariopsis cylindrus CCMP1102 TaxID=635003 RepID=A0A1E7FIV4_9STRA|nr:hypothetical protein FRACYDRAFT_268856 [Fragilariopsis cylindrus CCMP1102]|eukprot:OEU18054.1 hypothetical protein FRACYDRAFT_268856 [Fragilariopsis cylindrus CCMP1102]